jgi:hypothetical protein
MGGTAAKKWHKRKNTARVANLTPETPNGILYDAFKQNGTFRRITDEHWDSRYKYRVENGIRIVEMILQKHIPSHMFLLGNRILLSYEGQPITC